MQDEFLLTNKTGSYCSSDFMQGNTRKYHGLLVVADDDLKRKVILSRLEEKLSFDGNTEEYLNTNLFKDNVISPNGSLNLINRTLTAQSLNLEYLVGEIKVLKQIQMLTGTDQILISYKVTSPVLTNLKITPLLTNRPFHGISKFDNGSIFKLENSTNNEINISLSATEKLKINSTKFRFFHKDLVYNDFYYPIEEQRGYEALEDLIYFGTMVFDIYPNHETTINILFTYLPTPNTTYTQFSNFKTYIPQFEINENADSNKIQKFQNYIYDHALDFVVQSKKRTSIIAGYHWFEDWGRDTFISFNGLMLLSKNFDKAKKLLLDWSTYIKHGLIPNRPGLEEYNSLDATLWFIVSIYNYYQATKDSDTVTELLTKVKSILSLFKKGTLYGICVDENGFLISQDDTKALTWMDAVFNDKPFTPRIKAAVEIQMLWFNVLNIYKSFAKLNPDAFYDSDISEEYINTLIEKLKINFEKIFWNENTQTLNDYVLDDYKDAKIRPNPVIGLHLPFKLLSDEKANQVLKTIESKLLTPIGLKTLDSKDPDYGGNYVGDQYNRDKAYHNGTVWPWLYGYYLKSYFIVNGNSAESKQYVKSKLEETWDFIEKNKLNYLPEIFSAESLKPDGCLSQAWNYAAFMEVFNLLNS